MYKVIENFLDESEMNIIEETIMSNTFPWFYLNSVTDHIDKNDEPMYFHLLVRDGVNNSEKFTDLLIDKLVKKVNMQGVFRAKINSYTRTKELWKSNWHFDNKDYYHKHTSWHDYLEWSNDPKKMVVVDYSKEHFAPYKDKWSEWYFNQIKSLSKELINRVI